MEINDYASKYNDWADDYNWQTCKTGREEYGKFLCSFLTNTDDSLVVNLNGSWGTGKTELLRRLYVELAEQKHAVVYIDAWESDFSNDALAVVCSELLTQLDNIFDKSNTIAVEAINKLKKGFNTCLEFVQGIATVSGEAVTATTAKGAKAAVKAIPDMTDKSVSGKNTQLVEKIQKSQLERVQAMKDIKKQITFLAELMHEIYGLKKQIVILVDELDRCRPNYAIEMLEVIKHFFQTKGCVFLVATDTEALRHSVGAIYGTQFKSEDYLKRFFDRQISLSEVSILDYLKCQNLNLSSYEDKGIIFTSFNGNVDKHISFFSYFFTQQKMKLRDIDQTLQKFFASLNYIVAVNKDTKTVINGIVLMTGIIEEMSNNLIFLSRKSKPLQNFAIDYGMITDLIKIHLSFVAKALTKQVYSGLGHSQIHQKEQLVLGIQMSDIGGKRFKVINLDAELVGQLVSYEQDESIKYWLWDDYRKIIELSGHIQ